MHSTIAVLLLLMKGERSVTVMTPSVVYYTVAARLARYDSPYHHRRYFNVSALLYKLLLALCTRLHLHTNLCMSQEAAPAFFCRKNIKGQKPDPLYMSCSTSLYLFPLYSIISHPYDVDIPCVTLLNGCAELAKYNLQNQVTLYLNHVQKTFAVPYLHLDALLQTYRFLASGTIPGACQVDKLEVRCFYCVACHLFTCFNYYSLVVTKVANP